MTNQEAIDIINVELECIRRNDGVNCDRKCEKCDLVMECNDIVTALNMAIDALQDKIGGDLS